MSKSNTPRHHILNLIDSHTNLKIEDDKAIFKRTQDISTSFLDSLAAERGSQDSAPIGNFHKVASIPTVVVEKWMSEGFNIFDKNIKIEDILKRLASLDMEKLITTSKRLY
ncbi:hypothetical protein D3Y57_05535 [Sphingomonas paeninsulae]|uniref:Uncharacterized protein n=1 Tax=Sphingomonas paeninsulae TaxID=2319844 RepID=A0A494TE50_SPHPE|nr:hypothetical protein [Sphingomonas paeninsulae]AYJ85542.1 hypothetical protein D3Y57_05535 [Sphingomonas paeninsulae]